MSGMAKSRGATSRVNEGSWPWRVDEGGTARPNQDRWDQQQTAPWEHHTVGVAGHFNGPIVPADRVRQAIQGAGPTATAESACAMHDISLDNRPQEWPIGCKKFMPRGIQDVSYVAGDVLGRQDSLVGTPSKRTGDLLSRHVDRCPTDFGIVIRPGLVQTLRWWSNEARTN